VVINSIDTNRARLMSEVPPKAAEKRTSLEV